MNNKVLLSESLSFNLPKKIIIRILHTRLNGLYVIKRVLETIIARQQEGIMTVLWRLTYRYGRSVPACA
jgi:hypothetical protein